MRQITINDQDYGYMIGRSHVLIKDQYNKSHTPFCHDVAGVSHYEWERGKQKRYLSITPKNVANWIKGNLK